MKHYVVLRNIKSMAHEVGYTSSAISYSHGVPRHTDLQEAKYVRQLPMNSITNATTIIFSIMPTDDYIDLQESYLVVKVKVLKANGTALAADAAVALSDNVIGTLFKSVSVYLNGVKITTSNVYQAIENYFVTRFGTSKDATDIHVKMLQGLTGEVAAKNDAKNNEATGWTIRKAWTTASREATFVGLIPSDFFRSCSQFLPPLQDLKIEFKLHDPEFVLTGTGNFKYELTSFEVFTRQVAVASNTTMALFKQQAVKPLILNFTSVEIQSFAMPAGKQVEFVRGIFPHDMPHQIFLVLIETDRVNGVFAKDPYKFENAKVEKVVLRQNGTPVMLECYNTNFDNNDAKELYYHVCQAFDVGFNGCDVNLTYEQFLNGSTMWAWTLSPDMDANNNVALLQKPGNFEADIYVRNGYTQNVDLTALFIGKFAKSVLIGSDNKVSLM